MTVLNMFFLTVAGFKHQHNGEGVEKRLPLFKPMKGIALNGGQGPTLT